MPKSILVSPWATAWLQSICYKHPLTLGKKVILLQHFKLLGRRKKLESWVFEMDVEVVLFYLFLQNKRRRQLKQWTVMSHQGGIYHSALSCRKKTQRNYKRCNTREDALSSSRSQLCKMCCRIMKLVQTMNTRGDYSSIMLLRACQKISSTVCLEIMARFRIWHYKRITTEIFWEWALSRIERKTLLEFVMKAWTRQHFREFLFSSKWVVKSHISLNIPLDLREALGHGLTLSTI